MAKHTSHAPNMPFEASRWPFKRPRRALCSFVRFGPRATFSDFAVTLYTKGRTVTPVTHTTRTRSVRVQDALVPVSSHYDVRLCEFVTKVLPCTAVTFSL